MKIKSNRILNFYDVPLVFTALDSRFHIYLCYIDNIESNGTAKYFGKRISNKELLKYLNGEIDLRSIFENKIINLYKVTATDFEYYKAVPYIRFIKQESLPDKGFFNK